MKQDPRDEILVEYPDGRKFRWRYNPNTVDTVLKKTHQVTHFLTSVSGGYPVQSAYIEPTPSRYFADTQQQALLAAARDPVPDTAIQGQDFTDYTQPSHPYSQNSDSTALATTRIVQPKDNPIAYIRRSFNHSITKNLLIYIGLPIVLTIGSQELLTVSNRCYPFGYWTKVQLLNNTFKSLC